MHNMKHSRAVSSNNLSERRLIFRARKARQLESVSCCASVFSRSESGRRSGTGNFFEGVRAAEEFRGTRINGRMVDANCHKHVLEYSSHGKAAAGTGDG